MYPIMEFFCEIRKDARLHREEMEEEKEQKRIAASDSIKSSWFLDYCYALELPPTLLPNRQVNKMFIALYTYK